MEQKAQLVHTKTQELKKYLLEGQTKCHEELLAQEKQKASTDD